MTSLAQAHTTDPSLLHRLSVIDKSSHHLLAVINDILDISNLESQRLTLESKGFKGMPLNYQERRIYHWHEELDRRIGLNEVPPELRVEQVLSDQIATA